MTEPQTGRPLSRRQFLTQAAASAAALPLAAARAAPGGPARATRPNLLYVFSDQQASDMLGCYGNGQIITPHLDQFASQGVRFRHCVSNSPVCTPHRAMLMTGQHPLHNGCLSNDIQLLPGNGAHFGEVLRDAGYRMGYVGKWHLYGGYRNRPIPAGPHRHGFDHVFQSNNCHVNYHPGKCYYWTEEGQKVHFEDWEQYGQTKQALGFLDKCRADEPFALFVSWHPPHDHAGLGKYAGYSAPADMLAKYDISTLELRPNTPDTQRHRRMLHGHMALCTSVDVCFGWLMDKLRAKGLAHNTIVVFSSDHGDMLRWIGKRRLVKTRPEEESAHVPLLVRWPARLSPRTSDLLIGTMDLMPTLLGLMACKAPQSCHGHDLSAAVLTGNDRATEAVPLFMHPGFGWRGVYTRDYTYSFSAHQPEALAKQPEPGMSLNRLHHHASDPNSVSNLFDSPKHRGVREGLHQRTLAWMEQIGDPNLPWRTLASLCLVQGRGRTYRKQDATGELKGRPVDLIHAR